MANGEAFDDAVLCARANPSLDVGCHLVLIQGRSLVTGADLPATWTQLMVRLATGQMNCYQELRAQLEKITATGVRLTHLDTHKHTHVIPSVFSALMRLALEFEIPFIRLPYDSGWGLVRPLDRYGRKRLARDKLRFTDHFMGFRLTDHLSESSLIRSLAALPAGSTEFMCHPGFLRADLQRAITRLKETRQQELAALTSESIKREIERRNIILTNYRELAQSRS
jgi:predicted glycoside hydrolase/deacetylase ChbG (UPF0249 family)